MVFFQKMVLLTGGTAAAVLMAFPTQAKESVSQKTPTVSTTDSFFAQADTAPVEADADVSGREAAPVFSGEFADVLAQPSRFGPTLQPTTEPKLVADRTLDDYLASTPDSAVELSDAPAVDVSVSTSAESFFTEAEVDESEAAQSSDSETVAQSEEVAQVTRPLYRGVSPFYVGIGGNIGIIDSDNSAVGDFGFNVFSKISLGPRFSLRPMLQVSEDDLNVTLPVTFNFNPLDFGRFSVYPSLGGGVDFGDDIGFLVNGGLDVPISRDFTLNSQLNWRVTEDTGLGISLGVGYNFPLFFE